MDELKRCPFCGSEPIQAARFKGKYHEVYCGNFFGCPVTPCTRLFDTEEEAVEAWNGRAEEEPKQDCAYHKDGLCTAQKMMPECDPKACDRRVAK